MADCNCKTKPENFGEAISENKTESKDGFLIYFVKTIGFLISLILLPFIMGMIVKLLFETIVLGKNVNLKAILQYYFKDKRLEDKNDYEDDLTLNENEVEMLNVEEIR